MCDLCDTRLDNAEINALVDRYLKHKRERFGVLLELIDARHKHLDYIKKKTEVFETESESQLRKLEA